MERSESALHRLKEATEDRRLEQHRREKALLGMSQSDKDTGVTRLICAARARALEIEFPDSHLQYKTPHTHKDDEASELETAVTQVKLRGKQLLEAVLTRDALEKGFGRPCVYNRGRGCSLTKASEIARLRGSTQGDENVIRTLAIPLIDDMSTMEAEAKIATLLDSEEKAKSNEMLMRSWRKDAVMVQLQELLNKFQDLSAEDLDALRTALDELRHAVQAAKV